MEKATTCILITGPSGIGKTTLVRKLYEELQKTNHISCKGFYTAEVRQHNGTGPRIGFDVVTLAGKHGILARDKALVHDNQHRATVGKYSVFVQDFEAVALPELAALEKSDLLIIDEIGKMELMSKPFETVVTQLMKKQQFMIATVPQQTRQVINIVEELKSAHGSKLYEVTKSNRNSLLTDILANLEQLRVK